MKKLLIRLAPTIIFIFFLIIVGCVSYKFGKGQGSLMFVCHNKIHEVKVQLAVEKEFTEALDYSVLWLKNHISEKGK